MLTTTAILYAQKTKSDYLDTAINLPKGTYLKEGSLYVRDGYKILQSTDKKTITIVPENAKSLDNTPESTPNIKCKCDDGKDCGITFTNRKIECFSAEECCKLYMSKSSGILATTSGDIKWEQVRSKPSTTLSTNTDKIDITEQFNNKKIRNGTVLVYGSEGKYKIYATYKKGKLVEWYGMGEDGKKIKSSPLGITPTSCEDCLVAPNGTMYCKKCTTTPAVILPAKSAN